MRSKQKGTGGGEERGRGRTSDLYRISELLKMQCA